MESYTKVDVLKYVKEGLLNGTLIPREAEKFARIIARQGIPGEEVISWSVDKDLNEIKEKVGVVKVDPETNETGFVVVKADENGNAIIDNNGHTNEWIIDYKTFKKKYEVDPDNPNLFRPTGGVQIFVQINDNIILNQWGSDMQIAKGGYINITNIEDMYGISERDFLDTYKFINENPTETIGSRTN